MRVELLFQMLIDHKLKEHYLYNYRVLKKLAISVLTHKNEGDSIVSPQKIYDWGRVNGYSAEELENLMDTSSAIYHEVVWNYMKYNSVGFQSNIR